MAFNKEKAFVKHVITFTCATLHFCCCRNYRGVQNQTLRVIFDSSDFPGDFAELHQLIQLVCRISKDIIEDEVIYSKWEILEKTGKGTIFIRLV